jgi:hypothetical protein
MSKSNTSAAKMPTEVLESQSSHFGFRKKHINAVVESTAARRSMATRAGLCLIMRRRVENMRSPAP